MIQDFYLRHKGETVLVVGNGPSLDQTPLEKLSEKYPTFCANKIYDSKVHDGFLPTYWAGVDHDMLHETLPWLTNHPEFRTERFIPREFQLSGFHLLNVKIGHPISKDASEYVALGGTVTVVNLQLAYYMGATTVLLVGVDHNYPIRGYDGPPGSKFIGDGEDQGHFQSKSGAYFAKGQIYNRPELDATGSISYPAVRKMFEADHRKVINLTPGTKLEAFEKGDWKKWL